MDDPTRTRRAARSRRVLVAGGAAFLLAGCGGLPQELDGDLTGDWGDLPAPVTFVPEAGVCHPSGYQSVVTLAGYQPVPCDQPHQVETVHVGSLADDVPESAEAPTPESEVGRRAYRECEEQAADYLGADFRHGRLWLGVALPSAPGWDGGARWFRCDLMELESVYGDPVRRSAPLAGALAGDDAEADLRLGCFSVSADGGEVEELTGVPCDDTHQAEFVGTWQAPDGPWPDPADGAAEDRVYEGCRERVAEYVDVPADGDLVYRTGAIADWVSESAWRSGDRAFRCYLWLPGEELTGSLFGAGADALPVRTG